MKAPAAADIADRLDAAGVAAAPGRLRLERREDRWLVRLPGERLAWFPANARGAGRLRRERAVLRLLASRCTFAVPRILFESPEGWDVRAAVPGDAEPWTLYARLGREPALAATIGKAVGAMLAEQHRHVVATDVAGWLPTLPDWPAPAARLRAALPGVVDDPALLAQIEAALACYEGMPVEDGDRALVHGDLGLHNLAIEAKTGAVRGIFDYGGASWSDRHHDFRYLLLDAGDEGLLDAALAVYEPATGVALSRPRIRLYNAACAIGFLADRRGVAPEARPAGRTLAEDLRWVREALGRLRGRPG